MANFSTHLKTGAIVGTIAGAGFYLIRYAEEKKENPLLKFNWEVFVKVSLAGCAFGAIAGVAADKIEPALSPNHRGFFHSYTIWFLGCLAVLEFVSGNKENIWKNLAVIGFAGYSSHLFLDSLTPKSLPIIGL